MNININYLVLCYKFKSSLLYYYNISNYIICQIFIYNFFNKILDNCFLSLFNYFAIKKIFNFIKKSYINIIFNKYK